MRRLKEEGIACAVIDLSMDDTQQVTQEQWYASMIRSVASDFNLNFDVRTWWREHEMLSPLGRFRDFIEGVLLKSVTQNIVIFIDEIDSVLSLDFPTDDFFAFIRACYNQRVDKPAYQRLTFTLLGVATPSDLIQDKKRTPFNIGRSIELHGFSLDEVWPLTKGLEGKVGNPLAVLREVLAWTGGQPFLTQKLCRLIQSSSSPISQGSETKCIDELVRKSVIENWEAQDIPQHLRTIRDRICRSTDTNVRLLSLYQQILQQGEIAADDNPEQIELRLSGLVVKQGNSLIVYNRIYQDVFNQSWVDRELAQLRPYAESLKAWLNSKRQDKSHLLRGQALQDALKWAEEKSLGDQDYQFLSASQELDRTTVQKNLQIVSRQKKRSNWWAGIAATAAVIAVLGGGLVLHKSTSCQSGQERLNGACSLVASSGESILFRSSNNNYLTGGTKAFKSGNYSKAIEFFQKAVDFAPNDPEPQIYLNNAQARRKGSPFTLAVVVPVDNNANKAKEMLRGVADAQTKFNKIGGLNGRLLEIVIANDGDDKAVASKVAHQLTANPAVLGVIGHNSSDASLAALSEYEKANLAIVSPTSTSSSLRGRVLFRTVPSDRVAGRKLAEYAKATLDLDKVVIFFDSKSIYSTSLQQAFESDFTALKGSVVRIVDLTPDLDAKAEIERSVNQDQVRVAVLLPSTQTKSVAISIASANAQLPQEKRLQLLGGDALYSPDTLIQGRSAVEGLALAVPSFGETSYAKEATDRWKGNVSWITATSYDATQALINALSSNATRETVLEKLRSVDLPPDKTSGGRLRFWATGEPDREFRLVCVGKGGPPPQGSEYSFQPCSRKTLQKTPGKRM
jgi:ABC-type branched-subunit amino acid transport system substrate-binding protein